MKELVKGLWVGSFQDCNDHHNVMPTIHIGIDCNHHITDTYNQCYEIQDTEEDASKILEILQQSKAFITMWRKCRFFKGVLVHCTAGLSRSATLIFLYLHSIGEIKTYRDFKTIYPAWFPNNGFEILFRKLGIE